MKRYYIVYEGIVQGVGFRWKIMTLARKYNLTGYVRNLDNGNVEAEVQGNGVDEFLKESLSRRSLYPKTKESLMSDSEIIHNDCGSHADIKRIDIAHIDFYYLIRSIHDTFSYTTSFIT